MKSHAHQPRKQHYDGDGRHISALESHRNAFLTVAGAVGLLAVVGTVTGGAGSANKQTGANDRAPHAARIQKERAYTPQEATEAWLQGDRHKLTVTVGQGKDSSTVDDLIERANPNILTYRTPGSAREVKALETELNEHAIPEADKQLPNVVYGLQDNAKVEVPVVSPEQIPVSHEK